ncbi:hypothetical protein VDG1235_402 [Verrucomicrobiia bacterium DG1235]|nr:hypothetical protein VDG1235_402 [Verrucomicrobiae bacterium DG1235]
MIDSKQNLGFIGSMQRKASGKNVLLLFVVTMAVYLLMLLVTIPSVQSYAPDTALFDLSPTGYTHSQALSLLESLGQDGRSTYLFPQLAIDFIYPGLFAICFSLMFIWGYSKRVRSDSKFLYLAALPVFGGIFDYVENILIIRMIMTFPDVSKGLVSVASSFTLLKSAFSTASFLMLILGFLFLLKKTSMGSPQKVIPPKPKGQQGV